MGAKWNENPTCAIALADNREPKMRTMKKIIPTLLCTALLLSFGAMGARAATVTWTGASDSYFTNAANWSPGFPAASNDIVLGATATVDLTGWNSTTLGGGWYGLGALTFNSAAGAEITDPLVDPAVLALRGDITQSGSGDITNTTVTFNLGSVGRSFKGAGSGKVNFNNCSIINSGAGISVDGGYYVFRGIFPSTTINGDFSNLRVNSGGTAEFTVDYGNLGLPAPGNPSAAGLGQIITLNGGVLVLNSDDPLGKLGSFNTRGAWFTQNGGQIIWKKSATSGGPAGFRFDTTNGIPAVLVGDFQMDGAWPADRGLMIQGTCDGSGDVVVIVTNGANGWIAGSPTASVPFGYVYQDPANPLTNVYSKIDVKLTIIGPPNGNPDADSTSTEVGRFMTGGWGNSWNTTYHTNAGNIQLVAGGIYTRNVVQFYQRHTTPRFWGSDFTVENGTTVFCGGGGTGNSRSLYMGIDSSSKLTIKDGATAVFNQQIRSDSVWHGGRLNSTTHIEPGGTLKFKKTYSGAGGPIVVTGPIIGKGNGATGKESTIIVDLPYAGRLCPLLDSGYTSPVTAFPGGQNNMTFTDEWASNPGNNSTGLNFYPGYANLVVQATAPYILGMRIQGYSEFLTNILTETRLNMVTGSNGALTVAITNDATYTIAAGPTNIPSPIAIGFDNAGGNAAQYIVAAHTTATNWQRLIVRNARVKPQNGYASPGQNLRLLGGTVALDDGATVQLGAIVLSENATLEMGTAGGTGVKLYFTGASSWVAGKTLTIANWNGGVYGGGPDQIFVGNSAVMTPAQLAQVKWTNPFGSGDVLGAYQLPTGEIVPAVGQSAFSSITGNPPATPVSGTVAGVAGKAYVLEACTNLTAPVWVPLLTNTGSFSWTDYDATNYPIRFYRVLAQ